MGLRLVQWCAIGVVVMVVVALLPTPHAWVPHHSSGLERSRRYLVNVPPNSIVNFTGWTQTYVPLGVALFGRQPYLLNFG